MSRIRAFANGTEYMAYDEDNCACCKKCAVDYGDFGDCELQNALFTAEMDDGTITSEIAVRLGLIDRDGSRIRGAVCTERELK